MGICIDSEIWSMDDVGTHVIKLARDRLTWEHIAFAFALSGPFGPAEEGEPQQLGERTTLCLLRSLLTTNAILHEPRALGALLSAVETCAQTSLNDLMDDPASSGKKRYVSSDELAIPGARIKSTATIVSNVFFGIGDALGSLLASFTKLQIEQGSREIYAESAHSISRGLLAGHTRKAALQLWMARSNDETRSVSKFDLNTSFGILQYFSSASKWQFWRDWYQGFLDGQPLDWKL
ncbi:MAG: hypothetical protein BM558_01065 [Roseobacter sp. MedPE-SW]|nr:MAG: hypothetical protein BM558_01065 [Roseobacter sp. MedPE-SW]